MTRRRLPAYAFALPAVAFALAGPTANADPTKDQCVDADTQAQSLRLGGHLAAAREQLRTCVASACPGLVRDDCAQRLDEIERAQPTIVFDVQDATGHDLTQVTVQIDGRRWLEHLDGSAVAVDPGPHAFVFQAGQASLEQQFVIREGEKARRERVVLFAPASAVSSATAGVAAETAPLAPNAGATPQAGGPSDSSPPAGQMQRTLGWVAGGVGIGGLVIGSVLGVMAASNWSSAKDECSPPSCSPASHSQAESDKNDASSAATGSTVAFIAGGALVAGGLALVLTAPARSARSSGSVRVVPLLWAGSGGLRVEGGF